MVLKSNMSMYRLGMVNSNMVNLKFNTNDIHIFAHNFLNIQTIFNTKKVLESYDLGLFNQTINCYIC